MAGSNSHIETVIYFSKSFLGENAESLGFGVIHRKIFVILFLLQEHDFTLNIIKSRDVMKFILRKTGAHFAKFSRNFGPQNFL
jgi:hypothetical protein